VSRSAFEAAVARLDDSDPPIFAMLLDGAPIPEDHGSISPRRIA
jgi:hypothetical protein